ncbi:hypothetical protein QR680_010967 [Steinernema hermaphroditum]|uniref:OTU domain-containing protein n=1 Tax=Steinernema hermaphroditum TaxID=289476 RepID=A0AA39MBI7_9BILA|nr:hypothetical protein QR680_010967 [Steinernema hermaphroditum]
MPSILSTELHSATPEIPYGAIAAIVVVIVLIYAGLSLYKLIEICRRRLATNADTSPAILISSTPPNPAAAASDASVVDSSVVSPSTSPVSPPPSSPVDEMKTSVRRVKAPSAAGPYKFVPPATPYARPPPRTSTPNSGATGQQRPATSTPTPGQLRPATSAPGQQRSVTASPAPRQEPPQKKAYDSAENYDNVKLFGYVVPTYAGRPINWRPVITADVDRGLVRRYFLPPDVATLKRVAHRIGGRVDHVMPFGFPKDFSIHSPPLTVFDVVSDGNCLFRAISLYLLGNETYHRAFRKLACDTVERNKTAKWVDDLGGGNGNLPIEQRIGEMRKDARHLNDHCRWGGSLEMAAMALALDMNIYCFEEDNINKRVWQAYAPETTEKTSFLQRNLKKRFSVALIHGKHHFKAVVAIA